MADGRDKTLWYHTASVLALLHNVNCRNKSQAKKLTSFHPHHQQRSSKVTKKISVAEFSMMVTGQAFDTPQPTE